MCVCNRAILLLSLLSLGNSANIPVDVEPPTGFGGLLDIEGMMSRVVEMYGGRGGAMDMVVGEIAQAVRVKTYSM